MKKLFAKDRDSMSERRMENRMTMFPATSDPLGPLEASG
jgi:hypothetical protein